MYVCIYIYTRVHKAASTGEIFLSQDPALLVALQATSGRSGEVLTEAFQWTGLDDDIILST
jgi:hypothetical protein